MLCHALQGVTNCATETHNHVVLLSKRNILRLEWNILQPQCKARPGQPLLATPAAHAVMMQAKLPILLIWGNFKGVQLPDAWIMSGQALRKCMVQGSPAGEKDEGTAKGGSRADCQADCSRARGTA